ncbi:MAG: hypothetical protein PWQ91_1618 [Eubacteriales bacterium]|nr:hypothetical protein [Eubacteriales bacterium]MDN5364556.1 hypothetical protein [Eubacteriales bacterium]
MIISRQQLESVLRYTLLEKRDRERKEAGQAEKAAVTLPEKKEERIYNLARQVVEKTPDVREDRLAQLRQAIRTGTYSVSEEEIAEKIIVRSLVDMLI